MPEHLYEQLIVFKLDLQKLHNKWKKQPNICMGINTFKLDQSNGFDVPYYVHL